MQQPLDFFAETLAGAPNANLSPEFYKHQLDELFSSVKQVPGAQISVVFRLGDNVALLGMNNGELVTEAVDFKKMIQPVMNRL